ncbi:MAG: hypothetical protein COX77_02025 [Candidatus Komeilibacteria bacterium CG_4_10_14_0_2_um_filter_37_10]|uniref:MarR family transcriptional regulator n=1 Tax=Candidatus Komeilibacteria bacterium CG_4_10_14_0_2_um_filter_37_10 TaxID=1974470 RepID=A0A2M7VFA0_9BACT|nr:MAG: hypothetical protein COX77_02025 [Candidatus Komeilibacteria bacterium CG_4_10_14_0_2_um_filter_37_10]PJA94143.1 MAG: hypothetical protein CO133_00515 [Candidatus Komeilibacteria bacterium CG_4_9_14_3_um_filter_37_5]
MTLSNLQKYILKETLSEAKKIGRRRFEKFYERYKQNVKGDLRVKIISKSLERLIERGLLKGYGERTKCKWFITEVKLTARGQRQAKILLGFQEELPFLINKHKKL